MLLNRTFSILGDSYSTFRGFIPEKNACYYPNKEKVDDVLCVTDTWWYKLAQNKGMRLLVNNSYSGATVCSRVRDNHPKSAAFIERVKETFLDAEGNVPDYIMVLGCTNDDWLEREVGKVQFGDWSEDDLTKVLPSYGFVIDHLTKSYPKSKIVSIINTNMKQEITEGMIAVGEHYGAITVELKKIDKQHGHPSAIGMSQIAEQIGNALDEEKKLSR